MNHSEDRRARRFREQRHFFYLFRVINAEIELNDNRPLACRRTLNHGNALNGFSTADRDRLKTRYRTWKTGPNVQAVTILLNLTDATSDS